MSQSPLGDCSCVPESISSTRASPADRIRAGAVPGTAAPSSVAGSRATFTFIGTSVSWIGCRRASTGIAKVYFDGAFVAEIDTFFAYPQEGYQNTIYEARDGEGGRIR